MKVAPAKPKRPRIEGAAIGWRNTRATPSFSPSRAMSSSVCLRPDSIVFIIASLDRSTI
jgi:hypothetical protein